MTAKSKTAESPADQTHEETVNALKKRIAELEESDSPVERDAEVQYDPYDSQNPFRITGDIPPSADFPEGQTLSWKSPHYRDGGRGWRGWIPLQYGDEHCGKNGELLRRYLMDPPLRMEGSDRIDSYIRRGDVLLCRIDKRIWLSRQRAREEKSAAKRRQAGSSKTTVVREGISITGEGATNSSPTRAELMPRTLSPPQE